ncbi:MAG: hypothetical protein BRC40_07070 [Cyanobacteria bacterium QH_8_48_120]|nr:MAG: hypothetical protein BRC34_16230 [Cyanobacteria bacterium QH_1_48_107]PSO55850.1 MAG: hypothetical protein BRC35_10795 [Cyanobacteria bacterium QH_10_48_56]PSO60419.1 MAG: hypothetical protein BRC39_09915 [Cyanobacteria bacterium QH_7_48_89]PSO67756.1 MAG: hypothetical protein BRC42_15315 [Cyanobacteria bacterium QS_1_48_34]PSO69142.1 MAG: hypothetical protein BRC38_00055 [Cyanobacteria bacterium QH_6_48_35]PSO72443.1 MAG: hypothetical protein BRC37_11710 [Cyanobacteria bacterium QH_3_
MSSLGGGSRSVRTLAQTLQDFSVDFYHRKIFQILLIVWLGWAALCTFEHGSEKLLELHLERNKLSSA